MIVHHIRRLAKTKKMNSAKSINSSVPETDSDINTAPIDTEGEVELLSQHPPTLVRPMYKKVRHSDLFLLLLIVWYQNPTSAPNTGKPSAAVSLKTATSGSVKATNKLSDTFKV